MMFCVLFHLCRRARQTASAGSRRRVHAAVFRAHHVPQLPRSVLNRNSSCSKFSFELKSGFLTATVLYFSHRRQHFAELLLHCTSLHKQRLGRRARRLVRLFSRHLSEILYILSIHLSYEASTTPHTHSRSFLFFPFFFLQGRAACDCQPRPQAQQL